MLVLVIVWGVFFRLINLDRKVYWVDEVYSSLRVTGELWRELDQQVIDDGMISSKELLKFTLIPSEKGVNDVIKGLAIEEPHKSPLYFVMLHQWARWFGNSIAASRGLSAIISLLALPCAYWVFRELFDMPMGGWMAVAIIAISPFHVLYAQEAREYSLWSFTTLLSSAFLLRAIRVKSPFAWLLYAASLVLSFYSFLLSILISVGHGIYVFVTERFRPTVTLIYYLLATLIGGLSFLPWISVMLHNPHGTGGVTEWTSKGMSIVALSKIWILNLARGFLDGDLGLNNPLTYFIPLVIILALVSIYIVCRSTPLKSWWFILTLTGVTILALVLPDLIMGGRRSTVARYLVPCYLGLQLAIAYLFTHVLSVTKHQAQQVFWRVMLVIVLSVGMLSCAISTQSQTWWNKYGSEDYLPIVRVLHQSIHPLVLSEGGFAKAISYSYLLRSNVEFQIMDQPVMPAIPADIDRVFVLNSSKAFREALVQGSGYDLEVAYRGRYEELFVLKQAQNDEND